jgi:hypothetical protein
MSHLIRSDETFESRLKSGWAWQHFVACWLRNHGFFVCEEAYYCRPAVDADAARRGELPATPDLWLPKGRFGIEVKTKHESFFGPESFPYPTVLCCNDASLQKIAASQRRRLALVVVSTATGAMLVLPWRPGKWSKGPMRDGAHSYQGWSAPRALLRPMSWFLKLGERADAAA